MVHLTCYVMVDSKKENICSANSDGEKCAYFFRLITYNSLREGAAIFFNVQLVA